MRLTVKSDFLVLEAINKVEERRRGLGRAFSAPSELVFLHIVAVNSHPILLVMMVMMLMMVMS